MYAPLIRHDFLKHCLVTGIYTVMLNSCTLLAVLDCAAPNLRVIRQLWGLTVRGERALRATAPLWPPQQSA